MIDPGIEARQDEKELDATATGVAGKAVVITGGQTGHVVMAVPPPAHGRIPRPPSTTWR